MFIKAFAISVALSMLGINLFDRQADTARDCKGTDVLCLPAHAIATGGGIIHAALAAR